MQILNDLMAINPYLFYGFVGILGLMIGSFLNVVIVRVPLMMEMRWRQACDQIASDEHFNLSTPRSCCVSCKHPLTIFQNIPVLSFIWLRGRCGFCNAKISARYPIVEILTAVLTCFVVFQFGIALKTVFILLFVWMQIALSFIDWDKQILPDGMTLSLLWLGLLANAFSIFTDPSSAILGAMLGYLSLWSVYWIFKLLTHKEGMGYGDFKLLAALGAWFGWQSLPMIILFSSLLGAIVGMTFIIFKKQDKNIPIPFGPFLAIAGLVTAFWGGEIIDFYFKFALG